jgi:hypothetical protein
MTWLKRGGVAVVFAVLLLATPALVPSLDAQDYGQPGWFWRVTPYLWFANIDGINQLGDVEVTVGDTELYASFAGNLQVGKGRFRGVANFNTTSLSGLGELEGESVPDGTEVNYDFSLTTAELFAEWQVGTFVTSHAFQLFGGLRYVRHRQTLEDGPEPGTTTQTWVEPVAGAQYYAGMGSIFWATVRGDIGGIVFGSEFAWRVGAQLGAQVARPVHLILGYDYLQTEYANSDSGYAWDEGVTQGWLLGIMIKG